MKYVLFSLICVLPLGLFAQSTLTIGEAFDFDIGDEFHRLNTFEPTGNHYPNANRWTVIDKKLSVNGDTIWYTIVDDSYMSEPKSGVNQGLLYTFKTDTITKRVTDLQRPVHSLHPQVSHVFRDIQKLGLDKIKNDTTIADTVKMIADTSEYVLNELCSLQAKGIHQVTDWRNGLAMNTYKAFYGKGLGLVWESTTEGAGQHSGPVSKMFYYKKAKSTDSCGSPDLTTSIERSPQEKKMFRLYPNPARSTLQIESSNTLKAPKLSVQSMSGRVVFQDTWVGNQLDISYLPTGAYILKLQAETGVYSQVFLVE